VTCVAEVPDELLLSALNPLYEKVHDHRTPSHKDAMTSLVGQQHFVIGVAGDMAAAAS
jgi:hypothetical protein